MKKKVYFIGYGPPTLLDPEGLSHLDNPTPTEIEAWYDTDTSSIYLSDTYQMMKIPEGSSPGCWKRIDGISTSSIDVAKQCIQDSLDDPDIGQEAVIAKNILKRSNRDLLIDTLVGYINDTNLTKERRTDALDKLTVLLLDATDD